MSKPESHVAILFHSLDVGGAERLIVNLAQDFVKQGLQVDLLLRHVHGRFLQQLPADVHIVDLGQGYLENLKRLVAYLRHEQPQSLMAKMYPQNELAIIARFFARSNTRIIVSIHSVFSGQQDVVQFRWRVLSWIHTPLVKLLARYLYGWADAIVTDSKASATDFIKHTGIDAAKIHVVHNPVISAKLLEKARQPLHHLWFASGQSPVIVSVGRLHKIKDIATLIRAFALLRQTTPARLLILGEGLERNALCDLILALGVEEDVMLEGAVDNPYPYIHAAAVLVSSSRYESLSTVLIEAMALGTAVVGTDCPGGTAEILADGQYGELVPVGDSSAMAAAILRVLAGNVKVVDTDWLEQFTDKTSTQGYLQLLEME